MLSDPRAREPERPSSDEVSGAAPDRHARNRPRSRLQQRLLAWGARTRRDLPWRRTRDPWLILLSELMLQQTQAARVAPRYERFVLRYPTPAACARAEVGEVVQAWAGLGYNRRAVHLHRAARALVRQHAGTLPADLDALQALPGVGRYTARAVLVFAFDRPIGLVDVNAGRFLARAAAGRPLAAQEAQALADALVPAGDAWAWGQAVFDLGALVCTRRAPACAGCPIASHCAWATAGFPSPDPIARSAAIGRAQSAFAGSDRQGRGRLIAALRAAPIALSEVASAAGWPDDPERAARIVDALVAEGLATRTAGSLELP